MGQKRTYRQVRAMSALPPIKDVLGGASKFARFLAVYENEATPGTVPSKRTPRREAPYVGELE